jgi:hypothetical protein
VKAAFSLHHSYFSPLPSLLSRHPSSLSVLSSGSSVLAYCAEYIANPVIVRRVATVLPNTAEVRDWKPRGVQIVKAANLCCALAILALLSGIAAAAGVPAVPPVQSAPPVAPVLSPASAAICTYACYTCKPMPCLTSPPCGGICQPYCCKPMPCITCPPCDGLCQPYCCKPMPCICNPLARPWDCCMPACFGSGIIK